MLKKHLFIKNNFYFSEVPTSERRLKKDVKNYRMLQLFVVDLERENATLRRENKTLRSRADVLLDIMVSWYFGSKI